MFKRGAASAQEAQVELYLSAETESAGYEWLRDLREGELRMPFIPGYNEMQLVVSTRLPKPATLYLNRVELVARPAHQTNLGCGFSLQAEYWGKEAPVVPLPAASPEGFPKQVRIPFRFSYAGLPSKEMYVLTLRAAPDAVVADGAPVLASTYTTVTLYIPALPVPPKIAEGRPFFCVPLTGEGFPYRDAQGKPIEWRRAALRKWTLVRRTGNTLEFAIEGTPTRAYYEWDGISDLPTLLPMIDEPTVRQLKARYEGKRVWGYGGLSASAVLPPPSQTVGLGFEKDKPARILRIVRVWRPWTALTVGSMLYIGGRDDFFYTHQPLLVQLLPEGRAKAAVGVNAGIEAIERVMSQPRRYAIGFIELHADLWDFERSYSLQSPYELSRRWSATERRAWRSGELAKGIRHEVVAWILGWPPGYGTKDDLKRLDLWVYPDVPFPAELYFRNGRLVRWEFHRLP